MKKKSKDSLDWCVVRLGEDMNWWVEETSDPVNWDVVDGLSILDPRQISYVVDLSDPLVDYGFQPLLVDKAFIKFEIEKDLGKGRIRLKRVPDSLFDDPSHHLFALPDTVDEERGPYADLLQNLTKFRVKMLNDVIELEEHLTIEDLEDEIREKQNEEYMEGKAVHLFNELVSVLEYVPEGFEIDDEEAPVAHESSGLDEEFPDLEEDDDSLEEDETMKWGDEDDELDEEEEKEDDFDADLMLPSKKKGKSGSLAKPEKVVKAKTAPKSPVKKQAKPAAKKPAPKTKTSKKPVTKANKTTTKAAKKKK